MKFITLFSVNIICSFLIITASLTAKQANYHIKARDIESARVFVKAEFQMKSDTLYMSPYGPMPERWDDYVRNISMTDSSGSNIQLTKEENTWVAHASEGRFVNLSYEVMINHDEIEWPGGIDGVAFTNKNGYFLTGRSLFIMNDHNRENIAVAFSVPDSWNVSTPWTGNDNQYSVMNQEDLMESLIMMGKHQKFPISSGDLTIDFVLSGDQIISQSDQFTSIARATMDYYIDTMGGTPTPGGNRSANIMVAINEADQVDGEVIGGHISILLNPESPPEQQMVGWFMFAHEFFHLWNGKTLQVSGTKEDWFKEGITNYYTIKALYQIGFVNDQALAGILNGLFYQRYRNDPGFGKLSMREAAEGFSKDNHWGLIYGGGLFAGIAIDIMMRENTENQRSLDDVMRSLYDTHAGTSDTYSTEDIESLIYKISGLSTDEFFQNYIYGTTPIPIENYLAKAGYDVQIENGQMLISTKEEMRNVEEQIHRGFLGYN